MDKIYTITLGQIIKPRGLKGELKVKPFSDDLAQFQSFREVFVGTTPFCVLEVKVSPPFVYLSLEGVDSLDAGERLRGKEVSVRRAEIDEAEEGEYFISDLIGCKFMSGELEGVVVDVHQFGSADVIEVKLKNGKKMSFPHLLKLGLSINIQKKTITADRQLLDSVMVVN